MIAAMRRLAVIGSFLVLLLTTGEVYGQFVVSGRVIDGETGEPLASATVIARAIRDTTQQIYVSTSESGIFQLELKSSGYYKFRINFVGYVAYEKILRITEQVYSLGSVAMQTDTRLLDEVTVKGNPLGVEQYGDTTAYRANSFKTNPDASAEDLVRKLPGVSVDGTTVKAQGENVKRVLVDGREFFGDDPSATLKNLPADIIEKIEIFDRLSDQAQYTGVDDGNTSKTINIVTRPETRNGQFGRFSAGAGDDEHYTLGGNWNYFNNARRLSILGLSNNVNTQNFSSEDLVGVAGSGMRVRGGRGGREFGGNQLGNFLGQESGGINRVSSFGVNYSDQLGKKLQLTASYFFNHQTNESLQELQREYLLQNDSSQFYQENETSSSVNNNHRVSMRLEYNLNENDLLIYSPRISFQENNQFSSLFSQTNSQQDKLLNQQIQQSDQQNAAYLVSNDLLFRHRFEKRGRTISLSVRQTSRNNNSDANQFSLTKYTDSTPDSLDQVSKNQMNSQGISGNLTFSEGLGERSQISLSQEIGFTKNTADRKTYDRNQESEPVFNPDYSNIFRSDYLTATSTLGYSIRHDNGLFLRAMVSYENARLSNDQEYPQKEQFERSFSSFLPGIFGRWRFSDDSNLRFFYRTSTDAPSVNQLQNVLDNSNPLKLTIGNPELQTSYSHRLSLNYSHSSTAKSRSLFAYLNYMRINRYITNETIIAEGEDKVVDGLIIHAGGQLSRPVNLDGFWSLNSLFTYAMPVNLFKSNMNVSGGLNINRQPGLINQELNNSTTYTISSGMGIGSNISENVDFNLNYGLDWSSVDNSIRADLDDQYVKQKIGADLNLIVFNGWVLRQNLSYSSYTGLSDGFNQSFTLWNAGIAKKFLKEKKAEISLNVYDLLNQNQQVTRTVTENYIEDLNAIILKRYFMLTFTYRLRDFQGTPPPQEHNFRRREFPR